MWYSKFHRFPQEKPFNPLPSHGQPHMGQAAVFSLFQAPSLIFMCDLCFMRKNLLTYLVFVWYFWVFKVVSLTLLHWKILVTKWGRYGYTHFIDQKMLALNRPRAWGSSTERQAYEPDLHIPSSHSSRMLFLLLHLPFLRLPLVSTCQVLPFSQNPAQVH